MGDRYATHLPVLTKIMDRDRPARVLEYGAGTTSTSFFLNRPEVRRLTSVEVNQGWRERVTTDDPRHTVLSGGHPDPEGFDLIFIDDGQDAAHRVKSIRAVLSGPHPTVVIHDAEVPAYAQVIDELATHYAIFPTAPDTAVIEATDK